MGVRAALGRDLVRRTWVCVQRLAVAAVPAAPAVTKGRPGRPSRAPVLVNRGRLLLQHGGTALEDCEIYDGAELYLLLDMQVSSRP